MFDFNQFKPHRIVLLLPDGGKLYWSGRVWTSEKRRAQRYWFSAKIVEHLRLAFTERIKGQIIQEGVANA